MYNTKHIILYIAITSPQKNDLCTQPKIDQVKRSFAVHYNCYYVMENLCTCCQPSDINTFSIQIFADRIPESFLHDFSVQVQIGFPDFKADFWFPYRFLDFSLDFWFPYRFLDFTRISANIVQDFYRDGLLI